MDIKAGRILNNHLFEILEKRGDEVVSVKYKGVWLLCDNGYHNWSITAHDQLPKQYAPMRSDGPNGWNQ
jgi:hypothetical protein